MPRDLGGGNLLPLHLGPALVEAVLRPPDEDVLLRVVEREEHRVEAEAARHGGDDRLEDGVEVQVLLDLVGDLEDLVERLGAVAIAPGELLHLRADGAVLQDECDLPRQRLQRADGGGRLQRREGALEDEQARVELVGGEPGDQLVAGARREA